MNVKFAVNDYILIWNLLFQASISEQMHTLKQKIWKNYKQEYNNTYEDKELILQDYKNFIPNDDTIYNIILESKEYEKLEKEAEKYRLELMKIWDSNRKKINVLIKKVLKKETKTYLIFIVNEELDIIDTESPSNNEKEIVIVGKEIDKLDPLKVLLDIVMEIAKKEIIPNPENKEQQKIKDAIIELAILNELATNLVNKSRYAEGNPSLNVIKRYLYPYWLMYLGVEKSEFLNYMMRDKITFDVEKYAYEKELKKLDIEEFIKFCYRNRKYIIRQDLVEVI